jgi:hypothetical protein
MIAVLSAKMCVKIAKINLRAFLVKIHFIGVNKKINAQVCAMKAFLEKMEFAKNVILIAKRAKMQKMVKIV